MGSADLVALEEKHNIFNFLLLLPALLDALHPDLPDSLHLQQRIRMLLYHIQGVLAEFLNNAFCKLGSHALHQAGTQVFLDAVDGGREGFLKFLYRELAAVFCVYFPEAFQRKDRSHVGVGHGANDGDQVGIAFGGGFEDGVTVLWILVGDAFDDAAEVIHGCSFHSTGVPTSIKFPSKSEKRTTFWPQLYSISLFTY